MEELAQLSMLCEKNDLELVVHKASVPIYGPGATHCQIKGPGITVNYWPYSRKKTLFVSGINETRTRVSPKQAVDVALKHIAKVKEFQGKHHHSLERRVQTSHAKRFPAEYPTLEDAQQIQANAKQKLMYLYRFLPAPVNDEQHKIFYLITERLNR